MGGKAKAPMTTPTEPPAKGPAPTRRRLVWWLRCVLAWVGRMALAALAFAWVIAEAYGDMHRWSQWLFWTPREAYLLAALVLAGLTIALEPPHRRRFWARLGPVLLASFIALHTALTHWRWHNALKPRPGLTTLRVYHWNATEATDAALQQFLREADPFAQRHNSPAIVFLANPPMRLDWSDITKMLAAHDIPTDRTPDHLRRGGRFIVLSGPKITDSGWTMLGLRGATPDPTLIDDGTAIFTTIDLGHDSTTIWGIDWPSDPSRTRASLVEPSRRTLESSIHVRYVPTEAGPLRPEQTKGFPEPDIAVGDFNTGRQSAALAALLPGMASAHDHVGVGPDYTWPLFLRLDGKDYPTRAFLGLDQAFYRPGVWRARAYRTHNLGVGTHRAQEVELTPDR